MVDTASRCFLCFALLCVALRGFAWLCVCSGRRTHTHTLSRAFNLTTNTRRMNQRREGERWLAGWLILFVILCCTSVDLPLSMSTFVIAAGCLLYRERMDACSRPFPNLEICMLFDVSFLLIEVCCLLGVSYLYVRIPRYVLSRVVVCCLFVY